MNKDEELEGMYYCTQCGWQGKSSELYVCEYEYYEDYPPFFCPNCLSDEYNLEEHFIPDFWDRLGFFYRKITFWGLRRRMRAFRIPLKMELRAFFMRAIVMRFRKLIAERLGMPVKTAEDWIEDWIKEGK